MNEGLLCSKENPIDDLKIWRTWVIPEIFVALYLAVLFGYLALVHLGFSFHSFWGSVLAFSTSPFNFLEIFSSAYSSPIEGYLLNGVLTIAIIFAAILYYCLFASDKRLKPQFVFLASIGSSYIVSIFVWLFKGAPSTGTSIVGFCMLAFIFYCSLIDIRAHKTKSNQHSKLSFVKVFSISAVAFFSLIFLIAFYAIGKNAYLHFIGGIVCTTLLFVTLYWQKSVRAIVKVKDHYSGLSNWFVTGSLKDTAFQSDSLDALAETMQVKAITDANSTLF